MLRLLLLVPVFFLLTGFGCQKSSTSTLPSPPPADDVSTPGQVSGGGVTTTDRGPTSLLGNPRGRSPLGNPLGAGAARAPEGAIKSGGVSSGGPSGLPGPSGGVTGVVPTLNPVVSEPEPAKDNPPTQAGGELPTPFPTDPPGNVERVQVHKIPAVPNPAQLKVDRRYINVGS